MADEPLGLSEREKELRKWNAPYVFKEFPKMLYRGTTRAGRADVEQRIVDSSAAEALAAGAGWVTTPDVAHAREVAAQEALGTAAAERAAADRRLSPAAQAEAAAVDQATATHLGEIPEAPKRPKRGA